MGKFWAHWIGSAPNMSVFIHQYFTLSGFCGTMATQLYTAELSHAGVLILCIQSQDRYLKKIVWAELSGLLPPCRNGWHMRLGTYIYTTTW